ncbi:Amine oxidase [flavin-containing] B [Exaiptasia diaphana]|nr:Amine oxidase [flavin-containing] B [Exaiptasia diaphana]
MPKKVAVVGGGISGLAAAASLVDQGFDVHLLEASDYFGGRLKQVEVFPGFPPIDLGGDFIHGSTNVTHQLAEENGWKVKKAYDCPGEPPMASCIYIDGKLYGLNEKDHPDVLSAKKAFGDIFLLMKEYLSNTKGNDSNKEVTGQVMRLKIPGGTP